MNDKIIACKGGIYLQKETYNTLHEYALKKELRDGDVIRMALREFLPKIIKDNGDGN